MIHSVKGKIVGSGDKFVILDTGPFSLKIFVPHKTAQTLSKKQGSINLLVALHIGERDITLYGFENDKEKQLFSLLCSINGIGPRSALSILNKHNTETIFQAIAEGAVDFLSQMEGVGRKKAERIIVELKEVIPKVRSTENLKEYLELEAALSNLGYHLRDIRSVLSKFPAAAKTFEEKLKIALKLLSE